MRVARLIPLLVVLPLVSFAPIAAQEGAAAALDEDLLSGLALRGVGPALQSGRIADIAKHPRDRSVWYVAVASGGVWKTVNNGTTWTPIFDRYGAYSIGCVTVDPNHPEVIWVGTGENNSQRSAGYGDGVYRSLDAGGSFERMGLEHSEHIGKIVVDPRDSNVVYVAAQGPLWSSGGERGLYKTTDGGSTWTRVLHVSDDTGVSDLVYDPRQPDVLYAASYQRRRRQWALVAGGPESRIYKSTNAGASWHRLERGLPTGPVGRIGLAVSPIDSDVVYATIAATPEEGGFFRSPDRGASWVKTSDYMPVDPQYYGELFADPHRLDRVYSMDVVIQVSDDGGHTFRSLNTRYKHVDNHALVFDPDDPDYLMVGCDGGIYETWDGAATWRFIDNLPVTQFYRVGIDHATPFYNVYGGTQDNDSVGGPSRTDTVHGIQTSDWFHTSFGDGYQTRVDPDDPNIIYSMWQYGELVRFDRRNGELLEIQPQPGADEAPLRWNWDSPLLISPHRFTRLYFAANRLFRSDDRGDSWQAISGDLTRGLDRNRLPVMGRVWSVDAVWKNVFTSFYGSAVALDESPLVEGLLYVGSDDGLVHVSEDGGGAWRTIDRFPGVPPHTLVSDLTASRHHPDRLYALFNNHKSGDFQPYVLRSDDRGRSWRSIAGDLPARHVAWSLVEDHELPELLFLGTELGLFTTVDGGGSWLELRGGLPLVGIRDLEIQRREDDLVVGTFGRGIYILDDYRPLRHLTPERLAAEGALFPVDDAFMYLERRVLGWRDKGVQGDGHYMAPNPPFGAVVTYYLRDGYRSRRAARLEAEAAVRKEGGDVFYPPWEALRAEDRELPPAVLLTVRDAEERVVARLRPPAAKGLHRVAWNLRHPSLRPLDLGGERDDAAAGYPEHDGPLALPGTYSVELAKLVDGVVTPLGSRQTFRAVPLGEASLPAPDRDALHAFQRQTQDLQRAVLGAWRTLEETRDALAHARRALDATPAADPALIGTAHALEQRLHEVEVLFRGDRAVASRAEPTLPGIIRRLDRVVENHWTSTSAPTAAHRRGYHLAAAAFEDALDALRPLLADVEALEQALEAAGAPWTPGRGLPRWPQR